jgi:MoaA/NifB/PqqE/SkfB family radical SAM enzyme
LVNLKGTLRRSRFLSDLIFSRLYGYRSYRLKLIDIELSNKCNLRCKMCWFHGEQGIGDRYIGCELATREVLALVEEVSCHRPAIYIGGTEPFIRRDILTILEHIKKKNMRVSFTTNGTLLGPAKIEKLVRMGVDDIAFSIDGHRQLHDSLRGPGVFYKVTSAIAQLAAVVKPNGDVKFCRMSGSMTTVSAISAWTVLIPYGTTRNLADSEKRCGCKSNSRVASAAVGSIHFNTGLRMHY